MEFLDNRTGKTPIYKTEFDIRIDDEYLLCHYKSYHSSFYSYSNKFNDDIYKGDVVEIFIDVGINNHYFEIEISPNNTVFIGDIYNDGNKRILAKINEQFIQSEVKLFKDYYDTIIKIPLNKIHYDQNKGIKYNAFRIETDNGISEKHLFALNPTLSNTFHKKEYFIKLH